MPRRLLFDIEADGLLPEITKVHCIAATDVDTKQRLVWGPREITDAALPALASADILIAHNGIGYDFPALAKVHRFNVPHEKQRDTLVIARLIKANVRDTDSALVANKTLPGALHGRHTLEAWGYRLHCHKMSFEGPWAEWSQALQDYCVQDVETNVRLWDYLAPDTYSQQAVTLEHRVSRVCEAMTQAGWPFDLEKAHALDARLRGEQFTLTRELVEQFGSWFAPKGRQTPPDDGDAESFTPKVDNKRYGYVKGQPVTKIEKVTFNPGSRQHIFSRLQKLGWKPSIYTEGGQPKIDESVLVTMADDFPQASKLVRYLMIEKRLGQLSDGDNAWLKLVRNGRIHASYNPMGTVTGRMSHFNPNIAQVPALKDRKGRDQPFGRECRELFTVPEGWSLIGADMSGLELRCLSHYLHPLDDGEYAKVVLDGDVHTFNMEAAGLPERQMAKTFVYAWLYGAGAGKIGSIVNGSAKEGGKLITQFLDALPAVATLKDRVAHNVRCTGFLRGLDDRHLAVRSEHSALNTLLQSAGAILCKSWQVGAFDALAAKYRPGWNGDFAFCGLIHDEAQIAVRKGLEEDAGRIITECARRAGDEYGFRVRLDSDFKVGRDWSCTH